MIIIIFNCRPYTYMFYFLENAWKYFRINREIKKLYYLDWKYIDWIGRGLIPHDLCSGQLGMSNFIILVSLGCYKKNHIFGGLNNWNLFLTILGTGKSEIKGLADSESGEGPSLSWFADGCLLLVSLCGRGKECK